MSSVRTETAGVRLDMPNVMLGGNASGPRIPTGPTNAPQQDSSQGGAATADTLQFNPTNRYEPSLFVTESSLMLREVPQKQSYKTACWFEPLGYCTPGMNRNCWCSWHQRHFFNGQSTSEHVAIFNTDQVEIVKYNRMMAYLPMPFSPFWVRVFPIIEMFKSLNDLEASLNFGMMHYTLKVSNSKRSDAEISKIIAEHKAYFLMMIEAATNSTNYGKRKQEIPPIVRLNTAACVECLSHHLYQQPYIIYLMIANATQAAPQYLDLKTCSAFTQSMLLLFDLPYGFPAEMNVCLNTPPAYLTHDRYIVADQSKLHFGTFRLDNGVRTYGSHCTIMVFRYDSNGEVSFYDPHYSQTKERCVGPTVNRNGLYQYLFPDAATTN